MGSLALEADPRIPPNQKKGNIHFHLTEWMKFEKVGGAQTISYPSAVLTLSE